jgi:hypothetical protein
MRFVIMRDDNAMSIDNARLDMDCSALASNLALVAYVESEGKLQYNDRPGQLTAFTDPAPYQPFINSWITASAADTPPLQLAQAKQIKKDLVDAIYNHKRRLPYVYNAKTYDASDESVMYMTAASSVGTSAGSDSGLISSINSAFITLAGQINGQLVSTINSNAGTNNNSAANVNAWSAQNTAAWNCLYYPGVGGNVVAAGPWTVPSSGGFGTHTTSTNVAGATVGASNISWQPAGSTDPVPLSRSEFAGALSGIVSRRNALNNNRVDKKAAIDALADIPAVVAYDATASWSS